MSTLALGPRMSITDADLEKFRKARGWFFVIGIVMVLFGTAAISWACLTEVTIAATWAFGWLLLIGGVTEFLSSFKAGRWSGRLVHLFLGVLYGLGGVMMIDQPLDSAILLTRFIAIFLIVGGVFRIIAAVSERFMGWGAVLLNGIVTLLLGIMIYREWPLSGLWVIGLFFGIDLILNGWTWIMLAIGLGSVPAKAES